MSTPTVAHGKVSLVITYNRNMWWIQRLIRTLQTLPGIHSVTVKHVYKPVDLPVRLLDNLDRIR